MSNTSNLKNKEAEAVQEFSRLEVNLACDVYVSPRVIPQAVLEDPVQRITPFLHYVFRKGIPL